VAFALRAGEPGESVLDTIERLLLQRVAEEYGPLPSGQKRAAAALRLTARAMNYKLHKYGLRPIDQERARERAEGS